MEGGLELVRVARGGAEEAERGGEGAKRLMEALTAAQLVRIAGRRAYGGGRHPVTQIGVVGASAISKLCPEAISRWGFGELSRME